MRDFPESFLWGAATAAYQVEGGLTATDWTDFERAGRTAEPCGVAIDHWNRWRTDYAILAELGHTAHRMSLEWSRLQPAPDRFDDAAFAQYAEMLTALHGHGITPFVTLHHFTLPRWLADRGGWLADDAVELFGRYVEEIGTRLGPLLPFVGTINEPQMVAAGGYSTATHPPGVHDPVAAVAVNAVLMRAHRVAVARLRAVAPGSAVGVCLQLPIVEPDRPDDGIDVAAAERTRHLLVDSHIEDLRSGGDVGDWLGVQYYTRIRIGGEHHTVLPPAPGAETTGMGWEVHPDGFRQTLHVATRAGLPIYVTENGIATDDDGQRLRYLVAHLRALRTARDEGVDVRGYLHWSAFDNFEWAAGYRARFGLVAIDRDADLARTARPSAHAYRRVIETGRIDAALLPTVIPSGSP